MGLHNDRNEDLRELLIYLAVKSGSIIAEIGDFQCAY
jgi:hypothetical protein